MAIDDVPSKMSTALPKALQLLSDIGIIQVEEPLLAEAVVFASFSAETVTSNDPTGSLGASIPAPVGFVPTPPKQQPPLFWKAIGFCLKNTFTSSGSLSEDKAALFFASPGQGGIPEGVSCPKEVTNYHVFLKADTMQQVNHPTFSLSGDSYFEFLNMYLKHVGDDGESADLATARKTLIEAKLLKDRTWEYRREALADVRSNERTRDSQSLIDYFGKDKNYQSAWNAEQVAEQAFTRLRNPALGSVSAQLDLIRLADTRLEAQIGNNMPVIAIDNDWMIKLSQNPDLKIEDLVNPKDVYYRPEYTLPQYETVADDWIRIHGLSGDGDRDGPYPIPLAGIWDRSWSDLGHPLLDKAKPQENLTEEQKQFINSLSARLTFLQKPHTGDITRGLWDIRNPRGRFRLEPAAPQSIRDHVCKTSKLFLAWGMEIELTIPEALASSATKNITLAALNLPLKEVAGSNNNKFVFSAGGHGVPVLVGALADVI